jgi:archaeosine synthase beta-subunit
MSQPRTPRASDESAREKGTVPFCSATIGAMVPAAKSGQSPSDSSAALEIDDRWVLSERPPKNVVDPWRPYHYLVEPELTRDGSVEDVGTIFLTNRECQFRCLFCDLWKNTTDERVPEGAILAQIEWALSRMPAVRHLKLYNSGNFFDSQAIPPDELPRIADRLSNFWTVIVECHPRLIGRSCFDFQLRLRPALQVAMGLETAHPEVLGRLNKRMTLADFERAAMDLRSHGIEIRAFILLRPPFLDETEGLLWAKRSLDYAFGVGVECCILIPTRGGNGAMEKLQVAGSFSPPRLESLEAAIEYGVELRAGRVFADLWDIEKLFRCRHCGPERARRLQTMNFSQTIPPPVQCTECRTGSQAAHGP